jgi:hypothetical protein
MDEVITDDHFLVNPTESLFHAHLSPRCIFVNAKYFSRTKQYRVPMVVDATPSAGGTFFVFDFDLHHKFLIT